MKHSLLKVICERYGLNGRQHDQLATVLSKLEDDPHSPTAVRSREKATGVHISDSLTALDLEIVRESTTFADLGSGGGFPGLPLAIAIPNGQFKLLDSQARKCAFIDGLLSQTRVGNGSTVWSRAEEWSEGLDANDVVLARALAPAPVVLEYAAPLLRIGGALVDWRGRRDDAQEDAALVAAELLGMERIEVRRTEPYEGSLDHHLHLYVKRDSTPERFPRRAGVAQKRPVAASDRNQR